MYDDYNEILTVPELAELLKIGMNSAYDLINSGEIESFKVKNSHRIQRSAVTDYIIRKSTKKH
ncbi:helix-turn-helix domain-containing protein [Paenibacillus sp. UNC451MF]|uniref:helix-turn-helix domain-containing protein n=1 Tax=Paenibacillus sp. UNC451MF TaxID=1449063 RepID=UPI00048E393A|nr:helix-turn-helix domain-containing protein [Paenibacillus sp. UNC451MF]